MWKWWVAWAAAVVALGFATGYFPGRSIRTTIDGCETRIGDWTPDEVRCTGHWRSGGRTVTGHVHGVEVGTEWPVVYPRNADGWYRRTVPSSVRGARPAVQYSGIATTVDPTVLWGFRLVLFLLLGAPLAVLARRRADRWWAGRVPPA